MWCVLETSSAIIQSCHCHGAVSVSSSGTACRWRGRQPSMQLRQHTWESGIMSAVVIDIVGLFRRGGEDGCCIVLRTHLASLTDLHDSPFFCTSTNHIWLNAGRYSMPYDGLDYKFLRSGIALLGSPAGQPCAVIAVGLSLWTYNQRLVSGLQTRCWQQFTQAWPKTTHGIRQSAVNTWISFLDRLTLWKWNLKGNDWEKSNKLIRNLNFWKSFNKPNA